MIHMLINLIKMQPCVSPDAAVKEDQSCIYFNQQTGLYSDHTIVN